MNPTSRLRRWRRRLYELLLGVPVSVKVMGIALGMAGLLWAGMLWQIHETWHAHMLRELEGRGQAFAREMADRCAELTQAGRRADIPAEMRQALSFHPDAVHVILEDHDGAVLAEAGTTGDVSTLSALCEFSAAEGRRPHRVKVAMSIARVNHEVSWLTRRLVGITAIIALLGTLAAWGLTRIFAHPIHELVTLARTVKGGHYDVQAPVRSKDEVGELAAAFNEMTRAIAQKEASRKRLLRQVIEAGEEERRRIARELHDQTGQSMTSQIALLGALESQCQDQPLRKRLTEVRQQVEQSLREIHDLSVTLRPSVLDDVGLMPALARHCRMFGQRLGVDVLCAADGLNDQRLPKDVELTLYRVAQETLTNAVRHGQATRIRVVVHQTGRRVLATVQDNGSGFDAENWQARCVEGNHLGLLGIEERVTLLGGSFCVESEPGKGTTVYADIPLEEQP